jgi:uncharacterized protein (DUF433 family)
MVLKERPFYECSGGISMEIAPRISVQDKIRFGKPVIAGTRVPVELVLGKLAGGMAYEEVMAEYGITREDILAALDYAAKTLAREEIKIVK